MMSFGFPDGAVIASIAAYNGTTGEKF